MGEAKQRRLAFSARIREVQPFCIFCGGVHASETLEHYPPKIIFNGKHRPKGLEFGACRPCNANSGRADQIVGMLGRVYPDPQSELERDEYRRLLSAVERSAPGIIEEMEQDQLAAWRKWGIRGRASGGFLRVNGPIVTNAITTFGAKLGLALHYEATGRIAPIGGAVLVRWYSNLQAFAGELPEDFLNELGPGRTLRQGALSVPDQFRYASMVAEDITMSGHFAILREAFAVLMLVIEDASQHKKGPTIPVGFLRQESS